jgi:NADPH-dependent curcumin reductase CurA
MSVDPYMRYTIKKHGQKGQPIQGFVTGKILKSKHADWSEGDLFGANLPFSTVQQVTDCGSFQNLTGYVEESQLSLGLGIFGLTGCTAYAAFDLMQVTEKDTVWVADCCGAVGSVAGQLAKNVKKCKQVVGTCGNDLKCAVAKERFGYDAVFNCHEGVLLDKIKALAPTGIDFCLELVGGTEHLSAAVESMAPHGRIALGGAISGYNLTQPDKTEWKLDVTLNEMTILFHQIKLEGFKAMPWLSGERGSFLEDMHAWYKAGLIKPEETVVEGMNKWPEAFAMLFQTGNEHHVGKVVVEV